jgi:exopolysaccharide biosynthesis polyprenyl glycosylphosphotransferase
MSVIRPQGLGITTEQDLAERAAAAERQLPQPSGGPPGVAADERGVVTDVLIRERTYRRALALGDVSAVLVALLAAATITGTHATPAVAGIAVLAVLVAKLQGLYDRDELVMRKSTLSELPKLIQLAIILTVVLHLAQETFSRHDPSRFVFSLTLFLTTTVTLFVLRSIARSVAVRVAPAERTLILGRVDACEGLARRVTELDGVSLLGIVPMEQIEDDAMVAEIVQDRHAHRLVIAPDGRLSEEQIFNLVRAAKATGARVSIFPSVMAAVGGSVVFDELAGFTLLGVPRFGLSRSSEVVKRTFDLLGAGGALIVLSPLFALAAILIKLDSTGPVFFRQIRVGRDGRRFSILKFRSMVDGADEMKAELRPLNEAGDGLFKIARDPRITRVGRWLRRLHIDELPQLFNVIRSEMSLVGPRPLVVDEDQYFVGHDRSRLHLTPGMTGPWQVLGPMRVPLAEMAKLDYLYIANWSLWHDVEILLKTAVLVFNRQGI